MHIATHDNDKSIGGGLVRTYLSMAQLRPEETVYRLCMQGLQPKLMQALLLPLPALSGVPCLLTPTFMWHGAQLEQCRCHGYVLLLSSNADRCW